MDDYEDAIIREQAEEIEDLQEELVQVYAKLHEKEKRKAKRTPKEKSDSADEPVNRFPAGLRLIWWYLTQLGQLDEFKRATKQSGEYHASWQMTAFLTYFPLLVGVVGFILGAVPAKIDFPIRFAVGLNLLVVVGWAWIGTADLKRYKMWHVRTGQRLSLALSLRSRSACSRSMGRVRRA